MPDSVPRTAWSDSPDAPPPARWSSVWRSTAPPRAPVLRDRTYENPFVQSPRKRPQPRHGLCLFPIAVFWCWRLRIVPGTGHVLFQEARITKCAGFRALSSTKRSRSRFLATHCKPCISTAHENCRRIQYTKRCRIGRKTIPCCQGRHCRYI